MISCKYLHRIHPDRSLHESFLKNNVWKLRTLKFFRPLVTTELGITMRKLIFTVTLLSVCTLLRRFQIVVLISKSTRRFYTFATSSHLFCRNTHTVARLCVIRKRHTHTIHAFFLSSLHTIVGQSYFIGVSVSYRKLSLPLKALN